MPNLESSNAQAAVSQRGALPMSLDVLGIIVAHLERGDFRPLATLMRSCREVRGHVLRLVAHVDARNAWGGVPSQVLVRLENLRTLIVPQNVDGALPALFERDAATINALVARGRLVRLDVAGMNLSDDSWEMIGMLTALESLTLDGCNQATHPMRPIQTTALVGLERLEELHANDVCIAAGSMAGLRQLTSLTRLRLDGSNGAGFVADIGAATTLQELCLNDFGFNGYIPGLNGMLASLTSLQRLELYNTGALVYIRGDTLTRLQCLRHLGVGSCEWGRSVGIRNLVTSPLLCDRLTALEELDLSNNGIAPGSRRLIGMENHVSRLVNLRVLNLEANGLTPVHAPNIHAHMAGIGGTLHL